MGKLEQLPNVDEERYQCYTFEETMNKDHLYTMSHTGSIQCAPLGKNSEADYKVYEVSQGKYSTVCHLDIFVVD